MKRDGHTHTEFCPHGEQEDTELMILKAIDLGFKEYSITEHAPLPKELLAAAGETPIFTTASMALNDVDYYFKKMQHLRKKYASDLQIHIGFELDYFSTYKEWTKAFLNEYGPQTDDGLLSVHFLEGVGGLRGIDYTYEEYKTGIVDNAGSFQHAQRLYYEKLLESLDTDLGPYKPKRLGHISLCQKFERFFDEPITYSADNQLLVHTLLTRAKQANYQLDLNSAGFYKQGYQQSYPQVWIIKEATALGLPFVFGSDAHSINSVGQSYDAVSPWLSQPE